MTLNERQNKILSILKENRTAAVRELAKTLYVSEATVRRDLAEMQKTGLIERSHGGAVLHENAEEISMFVRIEKNAKEKERTAGNALRALPEFQTAFIDSSSTALALAQRMDFSFKTVVTNNLQTAIQLSKKPNINLILLGGNVQYNTTSVTGSWTARQIGEFSFDLMLASCAAVSEGAAFERSIDQKEIKRAAFLNSRKRILLVDHSKFAARAAYRFADLAAFDRVVTDAPPPPELRDGKIRFLFD